MVEVLREYLNAVREEQAAKQRLVNVIAAIKKAVGHGELPCDEHYLVDGAVVHVNHPEGLGPPVKVVCKSVSIIA